MKSTTSHYMLAVFGCAGLIAASMAGCSNNNDSTSTSAGDSSVAASESQAPQHTAEATTLVETSGADASTTFFSSADTVILTGQTQAAQLRGASIGIATGAPVLTDTDQAQVKDAISTLGASTVLTVGTALADAPEGVTVVNDPGTADGLKTLTGKDFEQRDAADWDAGVKEVASLSKDQAVAVNAQWEALPPAAEAGEVKELPDVNAETTVPETTIVASAQSPVAAIATARAAGADVKFLDAPDVRSNPEVLTQAKEKSVLALGAAFGSKEYIQQILEFKGETFLPNKRMVAFYGNPISPALGVMGEKPPAESAADAAARAKEYQQFSDQPVVPAFEIIATVAHTEAGPDGDYSSETDPAAIRPYIDAITAVGGYAVIDLQPGRGSFLQQAKHYQELLELPNVGLALDPEWKIGPNEQPLARVGNTTAAEINETSEWLAQLTKEKNLPQKILIMHQFQLGMIENREQLNLEHPELAFVLHIDGHGTPGEKMDTWNTMLGGLDPRIFVAWKNFIDEDHPTFDPKATMEVNPKPWFVSYQ